ncbi:hypothetical protein EZS27_041286, partial [termite gut metagenome]
VIVLFIGIFIGQPWIYFVFELTVLNGILVYMIIRHEAFSNRFYFQLQKQFGCEE